MRDDVGDAYLHRGEVRGCWGAEGRVGQVGHRDGEAQGEPAARVRRGLRGEGQRERAVQILHARRRARLETYTGH